MAQIIVNITPEARKKLDAMSAYTGLTKKSVASRAISLLYSVKMPKEPHELNCTCGLGNDWFETDHPPGCPQHKG